MKARSTISPVSFTGKYCLAVQRRNRNYALYAERNSLRSISSTPSIIKDDDVPLDVFLRNRKLYNG